MRASRIHRLLRLITMLQSGRSYTADELAEELEVSRRTIFRDLNMLEMAHIPYYFDRDRGTYRINRHFFLPPVNLTLDEALALLVAGQRVSNSSVLPLAASGQRASLKIESVLSGPVREYLGTVMDKLVVTPPPAARQDGLDEMFEQVLAATAERKVCRMTYISFYERKQMRLTIEPWRLVFVGRGWYLIAWSKRHRERRTFKLSRIKRLTVTDKTFDPPSEAGDSDFGDAWCMIPEGRRHNVHLRFGPKVAGNVAEVGWHKSQRVEWREDGSADFFVRVDGLGEITWWILGYGDEVKVIKPVALARRVAKVAARVAAQYAGEGA